MRTIKLAFAFVFMFLVGMSANTVSLNSGGISIETSVVEAAQQATTTNTTTTKSSSSKSGKAAKVKMRQGDFSIVTDKSAMQNILDTFNKYLRELSIIFSVIAGICLAIGGGLSLKLQAEHGSLKHPTEKIVATFLASALIANFWLALAWFVPEGDSNCTLAGFATSLCGNTAMPITGGLYDEIVAAQGSASATGTPGKLDFLGESINVVNSVSYLFIALGGISFISCVLLMKAMFSGDKKRDLGLLGRVGLASIIIVNHRSIIELLVGGAKLAGVWS